jgi:hypothetical protein
MFEVHSTEPFWHGTFTLQGPEVVGPSINNLVSAIHAGHLKKPFRCIAPPGSDFMTF